MKKTTIADKETTAYLKDTYEALRKFCTIVRVNSEDHGVTEVENIIAALDKANPSETYDKVVTASRKFFASFVKAAFEDEHIYNDDFYEDLFAYLEKVFGKLVNFNSILLAKETDKSMDDEILDMFRDLQSRTNAAHGSLRTVYAYVEDEINFLVMRYSNGRVNIYGIDTDSLWEY